MAYARNRSLLRRRCQTDLPCLRDRERDCRPGRAPSWGWSIARRSPAVFEARSSRRHRPVGPIDFAGVTGQAASRIFFPSCGPMPILNSTLGPSFAPADARHDRPSSCRPVRSAQCVIFRHFARWPGVEDFIQLRSIISEEQDDATANVLPLRPILISAFGLLAVSACQNQEPEPVASPAIRPLPGHRP